MAGKNTATAFGMIGLGGLILWSGITNAGIIASLQSIMHGTAPAAGTPQASFFASTNAGKAVSTAFNTGGTTSQTGGGTATGQQIAQAAQKYVGYPYVWGGKGPDSFDCYGLVTWVLHHDLGYNLPNNTYTGYLEFISWGGASRIDRSQVGAGDIAIWPTHAGIMINSTQMVGAEKPSLGVVVIGVDEGGPATPEPLSFYRIGSVLSA